MRRIRFFFNHLRWRMMSRAHHQELVAAANEDAERAHRDHMRWVEKYG